MQSLDVYISIRPKPKQNVFSVVIKGLEKNSGKFPIILSILFYFVCHLIQLVPL